MVIEKHQLTIALKNCGILFKPKKLSIGKLLYIRLYDVLVLLLLHYLFFLYPPSPPKLLFVCVLSLT